MSDFSDSGLVFRYSLHLRAVTYFVAVFSAWVSTVLTASKNEAQDFGSRMFLIFLSLLFFYWFYALSARIEINDDEIRKIYWFGRQKRLAWVDVALIEGKGFDGSKLKIMDRYHETIIYVEANLEGFEQFVDFIRYRRPDLWLIPAPDAFADVKHFDHPPYVYIVLAVMFVFCLTMGTRVLIQGDILTGILVLWFGLSALLIFIFVPLRIVIEGSRLRVRFLFLEKFIRADEITSISFSVAEGMHGEISQMITIDLKTGIPMLLSVFRPSTPILYNILRVWWEKYAFQTGENYEHN